MTAGLLCRLAAFASGTEGDGTYRLTATVGEVPVTVRLTVAIPASGGITVSGTAIPIR